MNSMSSTFFGPVNIGNTTFNNADGSASFGGVVTANSGVNINANVVLNPNGNVFSNGSVQVNGGYLSSTGHNELNFLGTGWDAGLATYQPSTGNFYHLIGTYSGWDPTSVYIAGYNAGDTLASGFAKSISFGGYGAGSSPTAIIDLIHHRLGVGTVSPSEVLDVNGNILIEGAGGALTAASANTANNLRDVPVCITGQVANQSRPQQL